MSARMLQRRGGDQSDPGSRSGRAQASRLTDPAARMMYGERQRAPGECHSFEVATDNGLLVAARASQESHDNACLEALVEAAGTRTRWDSRWWMRTVATTPERGWLPCSVRGSTPASPTAIPRATSTGAGERHDRGQSPRQSSLHLRRGSRRLPLPRREHPGAHAASATRGSIRDGVSSGSTVRRVPAALRLPDPEEREASDAEGSRRPRSSWRRHGSVSQQRSTRTATTTVGRRWRPCSGFCEACWGSRGGCCEEQPKSRPKRNSSRRGTSRAGAPGLGGVEQPQTGEKPLVRPSDAG